jgi:hypothetical protein
MCTNVECGLVRALPIEHDVNARILAASLDKKFGQAGIRAMASSTEQPDQPGQSACADKSPELTHSFYCGAASRSACTISSAEALRRVRQDTFRGHAFAPIDESVLKGLRAGRFKGLRDVLQVTVESLHSAALDAHATKVSGIGGASLLLVADEESQRKLHEQAVAKLKRRQVKSLEEYMEAAFTTVMPALWDQPAALLDFITLTVTLIRISQRTDWTAAAAYLQRALVDGMAEQKPYGVFNPSIFYSVEQEFYRSGAGLRATSGAHENRSSQRSASPSRDGPAAGIKRLEHAGKQDDSCCRSWNFSVAGCRPRPGQQCARKHTCIWLECSSREDGHAGRTCAHNPEGRGGAKAPQTHTAGAPRPKQEARAKKESSERAAAGGGNL